MKPSPSQGKIRSSSSVPAVVLPQAHIHRAGAGDAHAVAAFTEIVRERRDESQPPASFGNMKITGRSARAMPRFFECVTLRQLRAKNRQREVKRHAIVD